MRHPTTFTLWGDAWEVIRWDVPIKMWPTSAELGVAVKLILDELIGSRSRVAWIGAEGVPFCDPPQLFDPLCMTGAVLAWATEDGTSDVDIDLDAPVTPAADDVLRQLRRYASGLADVD